jgi:lipid-binding SYLF domain-containing protein
MTSTRRILGVVAVVLAILQGSSLLAQAGEAADLSRSARQALEQLYASTPAARMLGERARAVLVFPSIVKGGFIFGGQLGQGAMFRRGRTTGYYVTTGASYGFQAGLQKYGYALFFMTDSAIRYFDESDGFEVGAGPSLVVVDQGFAKNMTTSTLRSDMYAFVFSQVGLMGGVGLQGNKITRFSPE